MPDFHKMVDSFRESNEQFLKLMTELLAEVKETNQHLREIKELLSEGK